MITPNLITAPTTEPITLAEAKQQCRISTSSEDSLIEGYIAAARVYFEGRCARTVHDTTWEYHLDAAPTGTRIILPRATPLLELVSVTYYETDGTPGTMPSGDYILDPGGDMECGSIVLAYNASWPTFTPYPVRPFRIRYRAGIATSSPVTDADPATKHAIRLLVAGMYENRESEVLSDKTFMDALAQRYGAEAMIQLRTVEFPC
jgi:uncharacterized phiE125 gp8 family phage protein